jgi:hypothetical protein
MTKVSFGMKQVLFMLFALAKSTNSSSPNTCWDPFALDDVEIKEHLADDPADNIILIIEDTHLCMKRSFIQRQMNENEYISSICKKSHGDWQYVAYHPEEFWNPEEIVFSLTSISQFRGAISRSEIARMCQERNKKQFKISKKCENCETGPLFNQKAYITGNYTSANHCDPAHSVPMYIISEQSSSNTESSSNTNRSSNTESSSNTNRSSNTHNSSNTDGSTNSQDSPRKDTYDGPRGRSKMTVRAILVYISGSVLFLIFLLFGVWLCFRKRSKVKVEPPQPEAVSTIGNETAIRVQSQSVSLTEIDSPSMLKTSSLRRRRSRIDEW